MEQTNKNKKLNPILGFIKDKSAVFGLTSVQAFFAIMLVLAMIAYVIIIIMGTLSNSTVIPNLSTTIVNESGFLNTSNGGGYNLSNFSAPGFQAASIIRIINITGGVLSTSNYTLAANGFTVFNVTNASSQNNVNITYSYQFFGTPEIQSNNLLANTSTGITTFFASINPVYSILAVLVIILVLVVLVRVVSSGNEGSGGRAAETPL